MADAARSLPDGDPVLARLHQLVDEFYATLRAAQPPPPAPDGVLPLSTACARLGWSRRRLRDFCLARGVAILGTGRTAAVDLGAVRAAMASQPRVKHRAPSDESKDDINDWLRQG